MCPCCQNCLWKYEKQCIQAGCNSCSRLQLHFYLCSSQCKLHVLRAFPLKNYTVGWGRQETLNPPPIVNALSTFCLPSPFNLLDPFPTHCEPVSCPPHAHFEWRYPKKILVPVVGNHFPSFMSVLIDRTRYAKISQNNSLNLMNNSNMTVCMKSEWHSCHKYSMPWSLLLTVSFPTSSRFPYLS